MKLYLQILKMAVKLINGSSRSVQIYGPCKLTCNILHLVLKCSSFVKLLAVTSPGHEILNHCGKCVGAGVVFDLLQCYLFKYLNLSHEDHTHWSSG